MSTHADATPRSPASTGSAMALSIRQPWAWLIVHGGKDVENRTWTTRFRGPLLIHAGSTMTKDDYRACCLFISDFRTPWRLPAFDVLQDQCGGVIGVVDVVDCVASSPSPWFCGPWGFVVRNPQPVRFVRCKGRLGFFNLPLGVSLQDAA